MRRLLRVGLAVLTLGSGGVAGQAPDDSIAFEVASIRRSTADSVRRSGIIPTPGRFVLEHAPVSLLVGPAYRDQADENRGIPQWARTERFSINATYPAGATIADEPAMLRNLLRERFAFAAYVEEEEQEVLALVRVDPAATLPPGMQAIAIDCLARAGEAPVPLTRGMFEGSEEMPPCQTVNNGSTIVSGGVPMEFVARVMSGAVGRRVVDRTGLAGAYAFRLSYRRPDAPPDVNPDAPDIVTAVREQLGLRLVERRETVRVLVVDRFERPSDN